MPSEIYIPPGMRTIRQKTLARPVSFEGIGIYTRKNAAITVYPAPPDHGIKFLKKGSDKTIDAVIDNTYYGGPRKKTTVLGKRKNRKNKILCIEHLLATFNGLGITNALIECTGDEIPMMDGSAREFTKRMASFVEEQEKYIERAYVLGGCVEVQLDGRFARAYPLDRENNLETDLRYLMIYVRLIYGSKEIGEQGMSIWLNRKSFDQISDARTFCLESDLRSLKRPDREKALDHMVVFGKEKVLNPDGLRYCSRDEGFGNKEEYSNEPARHKLLDALGDLSLLGYPIAAYISIVRPGHQLNHALARAIKAESEKNDGKVVMVNLRE